MLIIFDFHPFLCRISIRIETGKGRANINIGINSLPLFLYCMYINYLFTTVMNLNKYLLFLCLRQFYMGNFTTSSSEGSLGLFKRVQSNIQFDFWFHNCRKRSFSIDLSNIFYYFQSENLILNLVYNK